MKLTWGHKLIGVFILFGSLMSFMVYRSFGTRVDLVSKEYYDDELEYQQLINGAKTLSDHGSGLKLNIAGRVVTVTRGDSSLSKVKSGIAWFYCVSDSDKDQKVILDTPVEGSQELVGVLLRPGNYIAKLRWTTPDGEFYSEERFNLK